MWFLPINMHVIRKFASMVLAEISGKKLSPMVYSAVNAADYFNDEISVLVAGHDCRAAAEEAAKIASVSKVILVESPDLDHSLADSVSKAAYAVQQKFSFERIIAASSNFSKDVIPRLGGMLEVQPISEIIKIMNLDCYKRAAYAGNAIYTVSTLQKLRLLTIRATAFEKNSTKAEASVIETVEVPDLKSAMTWVAEEVEKAERPDLTSAKIVVSGGRGLKNKEGFKLAEELGDCLGAAVGASRAAVDAHFCHNELQVGQTGKIVAPDLYIALGISGAIQHLAGMKDSKVIVAVNTDPEAPIFTIADYGLVGDVFKVVPELIDRLKRK
jgi:electron transfer flavoprotein alpha subunit